MADEGVIDGVRDMCFAVSVGEIFTEGGEGNGGVRDETVWCLGFGVGSWELGFMV